LREAVVKRTPGRRIEGVADLDDFEIDGGGEPPPERGLVEPPPPRRPPRLPIARLAGGALLAGAILGLVYFLRQPVRPPEPAPTTAPVEPPSPAPEPTLTLPPLAESDAFVRDLAKGLSSHPQLGAWLAARGLVRTLTVVVQNLGEGRSPARFLSFLTPAVKFEAVDRGGRLVADPRSLAAYDDLADGVAALDAAECVRVYRMLAPLFGAADAELGYPAADFEKAVARALEVIRSAPVPEGEIALRRGRVFLEFADPKLEALPLAHKHLLRMGSRNARLIQAKAAELAQALAPAPGQ
jgi:hypothetical protein